MNTLAEVPFASREPPLPPDRSLFGVRVTALTLDEAVSLCAERVVAGVPTRVGVVNAAKLVTMRRDRELRRAVTSCDLIIADGMAVVWASRVLGVPLPERVTGIDLFHGLLAEGDRRGYRVYLLGATDEVVDRVADQVARDHPGVVVVGHRNGYFDDAEVPAIVADIRRRRADLVFVGMSSPRKERFVETWAERTGAALCHGVGGAFDVVAGRARRAPLAWQRLGLEWLYRLLQEPRRLWRRYLTTNTLFVLMVGRELLGGLGSGRARRWTSSTR